jgi:hypothetical protein
MRWNEAYIIYFIYLLTTFEVRQICGVAEENTVSIFSVELLYLRWCQQVQVTIYQTTRGRLPEYSILFIVIAAGTSNPSTK